MSNYSTVRVHGDRLTRLRRSCGWTQVELSRRSGYSERLVRKAEQGGRIRQQTLQELLQCFDQAAVSTEPFGFYTSIDTGEALGSPAE